MRLIGKGLTFYLHIMRNDVSKQVFFSYIPFESLGFPVNIKQQEKKMIIKNNCKKGTKNTV